MVVALARVKIIDPLTLERTPGCEAGDGDGGLKGKRGSNVTPVEGRTSKLIWPGPPNVPAFLTAQCASSLLLVLRLKTK